MKTLTEKNMNEMPLIKEREDGKWHVTFLGKELLSTKNLTWVKSNLRKNRKVEKLGLRKFNVLDKAGKVVDVFDMDSGQAKTKPRKEQKPVEEKPAKPSMEDKIVKVVGKVGTALEGYEKNGVFRKREGRVITLTFSSKKDGIKIDYEFDAKTGEQNTHNYNHVWQIENMADVV